MVYIRILENFWEAFLLGIGYTLLLSLVGTIVGLVIALILGVVKSIQAIPKRKASRIALKVGQTLIQLYVTVIRGTPMMVQAMIFYYVFRRMGLLWTPLEAGLFTVSVNTGAYLTEVVKNGIESVPKGQEEAAKSLGMNRFKAMSLVILPQAIKTQMASIGNEFIINIKDTSVLNVIMISELYYVAEDAAMRYSSFLEAMLIAAVIYLFLTYTTSKLLKLFENKLGVKTLDIVSSN
ncbi:MAG: amino acid ABC transporter permease [Bacilli bacterium]|jgi:putative lysine transport system permease protein|nr:amino acid ABC transporter permease [Bacilli bacterium]MDD3348769.1 amino acid ABC transporter permease [Bacilli bacterium]MDD4057016.1 amino acid ABC transporter permease [Bacilli bacterium]